MIRGTQSVYMGSKKFSNIFWMYNYILRKIHVPYNTSTAPYPSISITVGSKLVKNSQKMTEKQLKICKRFSNRPYGSDGDSKNFSDTPNMSRNILRKYDVPCTTSTAPYPSTTVSPALKCGKNSQKWLKNM